MVLSCTLRSLESTRVLSETAEVAVVALTFFSAHRDVRSPAIRRQTVNEEEGLTPNEDM